MKYILALTLVLLTAGQAQASYLCPREIERLPVLSRGRVKPLAVHAGEVMKFITGTKSHKGLSATEAYCHLSLLSLGPQPAVAGIQIRVDHLKTRAFLGLSEDQKYITPRLAREKLTDMREYAAILDSRKEDTGFAQDLKKTASRVGLYLDITDGTNWTFPVALNQTADNPHKPSQGTTSPQIKWITLNDLTKIFKDEITTPEQTVRAILTAGTRYMDEIDSSYLLELTYDKLHLFQWAILAVIVSLFFAAITKRPFHPATWTAVIAVFAIEITGIVFRVLISGRAPVTNMYETVLWVGLGALFFGSILTAIRRERVFLFGGLVLNLGALFMMTFANNMLDPGIQPLVPVLRDNFWLSTHVTMITISYAAFGLSWVIANYTMIRTSLKPLAGKETRRLNLLCYDCLKIGVVLLAAGIILGGIWADYSWGRFWGWDPKETWALIALMTYIAILHGRYSGWITSRNFIPAVALAFLTIIMAWFGVNYILAAGLHSYGFSNGGTVFIFGVVLAQLIVFGIYLASRYSRPAKIPRE